MTNSTLQACLLTLANNLDILQQREAKSGGNAPLDLLNQIIDHKEAIRLTKQVLAGQLSRTEWHQALQPLLVEISGRESKAAAGLNLSDIQNSVLTIEGSIISNVTAGGHVAGGDIIDIGPVQLNLVPIEAALGQALPQQDLFALRDTLQQTPPPARILTLAAGASLIQMPQDQSSVRFYHQLLQEYFAGRELLKRVAQDALTPQPLALALAGARNPAVAPARR